MKEKITFENFLRDKHFREQPQVLDDDLSDAFDKWLTELQADDFIKYGEEYADWKIKECLPIDENTSDGYHTFKELYEFRKLYNALLFNEWAKSGIYNIHKSKKHSDGELCFGGDWFIVVASLPVGDISNHYEMKDWELFQCEERDLAKEWDGHTAQDVLIRLDQILLNKDKK